MGGRGNKKKDMDVSGRPRCLTCNDLGFVKDAKEEVFPCPKCNEDGMEGVTG